MTLGDLAARLGAELTPADGQERDPAGLDVTGLAGIETAGPTEVTFVDNPRYASYARTTRAAAVIVSPDFGPAPVPTLRIKNPYHAFARGVSFFYTPPSYPAGIHATAVIAPSARIGERAHIGAYVVVSDNCVLGDDAVLLPHVVLYPGVTAGDRLFAHAHVVVRENCRLGNDVILQNGVVVGADGFGFAKSSEGQWTKILQSGPAIIGNAVEIQANSCIDRATIGETRIGDGVKIDNLVQIGHGSVVEDNSLICAQVGLAGSSTIGKNVILAGQVGVAGHLKVGDGAIVTAQSGLHSDVTPGAIVSGSPVMDNRTWLRLTAILPRLPEIVRKMRTKPAAE